MRSAGPQSLTGIDGDSLVAFDVGPGNALLDDWVRRHGADDVDRPIRVSAIRVYNANDGFIARLDTHGAHLWSRDLGDPESRGFGIAMTPSGDIVVTASFEGTVDLGGGPFDGTDGDILVVAWHNHKLRHYDPETGMAYVMGGRGAGFEGDGGPLDNPMLRFNQPSGGTTDADGNIFLVDQRNQRIRKISADYKTIETVAGTGEALHNRAGRLGAWVADLLYFLFGWSAWWLVPVTWRIGRISTPSCRSGMRK